MTRCYTGGIYQGIASKAVHCCRLILAIIWLMSCSGLTVAQSWHANHEEAERLSLQKPGINFFESKIPAYSLPPLLVSANGNQVVSRESWEQHRREEVLELFREHVYGHSPPQADSVTFQIVKTDPMALDGQATWKQVRITISNQGRSLHYEMPLFIPNRIGKPVPCFLLIGNRGRDKIDPTRKTKTEYWPVEAIISQGYAAAAFHNGDLDPDEHDGFKDGIHGLFRKEGVEHPGNGWGALAAWAWGASRCLDYMETDPLIDSEKVAVVGQSRGGKAALWCGAEDQRFAMVVSNNSGCGGAALSRRRYGENVETINRVFPHWFCKNFKRYNDRENKLPVDQHMLMALIAPRAVYVTSADEDLWADPRGEFLALAEASSVYDLYNYPGIQPEEMPSCNKPLLRARQSYHIRKGKHDLTLYDWQQFMYFSGMIF